MNPQTSFLYNFAANPSAPYGHMYHPSGGQQITNNPSFMGGWGFITAANGVTLNASAGTINLPIAGTYQVNLNLNFAAPTSANYCVVVQIANAISWVVYAEIDCLLPSTRYSGTAISALISCKANTTIGAIVYSPDLASGQYLAIGFLGSGNGGEFSAIYASAFSTTY